jgi:hypothetical protein
MHFVLKGMIQGSGFYVVQRMAVSSDMDKYNNRNPLFQYISVLYMTKYSCAVCWQSVIEFRGGCLDITLAFPGQNLAQGQVLSFFTGGQP